jgi:glycosyltransferase involved in cell wall biosynthesis
MKVAALTSGRYTPSSRYRVRQHIALMSNLGAEVTEYCPSIDKYEGWIKEEVRWPSKLTFSTKDQYWKRRKMMTRLPGLIASWLADVTWLERILIPEHISWEPWLGRPLVFDFDDAIWMGEGKNGIAERVIRRSESVIAGNDYLAEFAQQFNTNVHVIPTAVDVNSYTLNLNTERSGPFLGWIGTSSNLPYLESIIPTIGEALKSFPKSKLVVISNRYPKISGLQEQQVEFIPWQEGIEFQMAALFDIGLMPLVNDEWEKGKCSFKLLQYMAAGLPVCASGYGMNEKVLNEANPGFDCRNHSQWLTGLVSLLENADLRNQMGRKGRLEIEKKYSLQSITPQIVSVLKSVV